MKTIVKQEILLKWFVLPKELYKSDFILEKFVGEDSQLEVSSKKVGTDQIVDDGFDKDYIVTHKRRKKQDYYY
ncbi:MAG: hypothetical protein ACXV5H_02935 [Halobacteriota archaeon]